MAFIRKVKTGSGATAGQIVYKRHGEIIKVIHIGSSKDEDKLQLLIALAKEKLFAGQPSLFPQTPSPTIILAKTQSLYLWETLSEVFDQLNFTQIHDHVFKELVLARLIEPASKLDTIRILSQLGLSPPSNSSIHRCLKRVVASTLILINFTFQYLSSLQKELDVQVLF